jgi:hypothetical protein
MVINGEEENGKENLTIAAFYFISPAFAVTG